MLVHTRLVCEALMAMELWRTLASVERSALFAAALLHDVGKPSATREVGGRLRSHRHAVKGAQMARTILWESLLPAVSLEHLHLREQIVALVHHHPLPLHSLDLTDPRRGVFAISQGVRLDWLAMLAEVDAAGRLAADRDELLVRVGLFRELARKNRCHTGPRCFASSHTRVLYFQGRELAPTSRCTMTRGWRSS